MQVNKDLILPIIKYLLILLGGYKSVKDKEKWMRCFNCFKMYLFN